MDRLCRTTEFAGNSLPQSKGMQYLCQAAATATATQTPVSCLWINLVPIKN